MYRAAQQWDHWLNQPLGHCVLEAEKKFLLKFLANYFGKHGVLIGVPQQNDLLKTSVTAHQVLLTPLMVKTRSIKTIEGDLYELPVASGSVDLVLLPHTLEYLDNPHRLLNEACRIVKPEGHILITGFNPFSFWGLRKLLARQNHMPWSLNFLRSGNVTKWLRLADFELVRREYILHRPPIRQQNIYRRLAVLDWLGRKAFAPLGGMYVLVAKAKVIPLTPIRMRWQQSLSAGIRVSMPGPSMRKF